MKVINLLVICSINKYSNITMIINNINYFNNWDCLIYTSIKFEKNIFNNCIVKYYKGYSWANMLKKNGYSTIF